MFTVAVIIGQQQYVGIGDIDSKTGEKVVEASPAELEVKIKGFLTGSVSSLDKKSTILGQMLNQTRQHLAGKYFAKQKAWELFLKQGGFSDDNPEKNAWFFNIVVRAKLQTLIDHRLFTESNYSVGTALKNMYSGKRYFLPFTLHLNHFACSWEVKQISFLILRNF